MTHNNYAELLRSPQWQKKRLEIMQRDSFTCQSCGSTQKTLTVHHKYYTNGCAPWDYPDECYVTLCEDCHDVVHRNKTFKMEDVCTGEWYSACDGEFRDIAIVFLIDSRFDYVYLFGCNEGSWGNPFIYGVSFKDFIKKWEKIDIFEQDNEGYSFIESDYFLGGFTYAYECLSNGGADAIGINSDIVKDLSKALAQHFVSVYIAKNEIISNYCDCHKIKYE